jgi:hypothetical protein
MLVVAPLTVVVGALSVDALEPLTVTVAPVALRLVFP